MAKFHGVLGFVKSEETSPGVYMDVPTERPCKGDILRNKQQWSVRDERLNDDLTLNNRFSVVGDPYIYENIAFIRYIEWNGVKWEAASIDIQRPRLIIHIRGVYNE